MHSADRARARRGRHTQPSSSADAATPPPSAAASNSHNRIRQQQQRQQQQQLQRDGETLSALAALTAQVAELRSVLHSLSLAQYGRKQPPEHEKNSPATGIIGASSPNSAAFGLYNAAAADPTSAGSPWPSPQGGMAAAGQQPPQHTSVAQRLERLERQGEARERKLGDVLARLGEAEAGAARACVQYDSLRLSVEQSLVMLIDNLAAERETQRQQRAVITAAIGGLCAELGLPLPPLSGALGTTTPAAPFAPHSPAAAAAAAAAAAIDDDAGVADAVTATTPPARTSGRSNHQPGPPPPIDAVAAAATTTAAAAAAATAATATTTTTTVTAAATSARSPFEHEDGMDYDIGAELGWSGGRSSTIAAAAAAGATRHNPNDSSATASAPTQSPQITVAAAAAASGPSGPSEESAVMSSEAKLAVAGVRMHLAAAPAVAAPTAAPAPPQPRASASADQGMATPHDEAAKGASGQLRVRGGGSDAAAEAAPPTQAQAQTPAQPEGIGGVAGARERTGEETRGRAYEDAIAQAAREWRAQRQHQEQQRQQQSDVGPTADAAAATAQAAATACGGLEQQVQRLAQRQEQAATARWREEEGLTGVFAAAHPLGYGAVARARRVADAALGREGEANAAAQTAAAVGICPPSTPRARLPIVLSERSAASACVCSSHTCAPVQRAPCRRPL
jgi:hypothetical protein